MRTRALEQFAARAQLAAGVRGEVDVLITSSAQIRRLNGRFRGNNTATDVLSFPSEDAKTYHGGKQTRGNSVSRSSVSRCLGGRRFAGDIAISADIARRNARRMGHSAGDELRILILHGLLHLVGYDHEIDRGEMARQEARLRRKLGLPMALIERTNPADGNIRHGDTETRRNSFSKPFLPAPLRDDFSGKRRRS